MADPITAASAIASSGLRAQSVRMRVVAENIANAHSTGNVPGASPYTRKVVTFASELNRAAGAAVVQVADIEEDATPYRLEHQPGHPAADAAGNVKMPNVDMAIELADMREAGRVYEANLQVVRQTRSMVSHMIDMIRSGS